MTFLINRRCKRLVGSFHQIDLFIPACLLLYLLSSARVVGSPLSNRHEDVNFSQGIDVKASNRGIPISVRYSANGKWLGVATDKGIVLYDVQASSEIWFIASDGAEALAISPDNTLVAVVFSDATVRIFDTSDGSIRATLRNSGDTLYWPAVLTFSSDGALLASGSDNGYIRVWSTANMQVLYTLGMSGDVGITQLAFSHDAATLVSINGSRPAAGIGNPAKNMQVRIWQLSDGTLIDTVQAGAFILPVGLAGEGTILVGVIRSASSSELGLWQIPHVDLQATTVLDTRDLRYNIRDGGVLSQDQSLFAMDIGNGGSIGIWSMSNNAGMQILTSPSGRPVSVTLSPDNRQVAAGFEDGSVQFWQIDPALLTTAHSANCSSGMVSS